MRSIRWFVTLLLIAGGFAASGCVVRPYHGDDDYCRHHDCGDHHHWDHDHDHDWR